jgi:hypothetical protein
MKSSKREQRAKDVGWSIGVRAAEDSGTFLMVVQDWITDERT